jgi:3-hydroxyacyl-CoA dehydrogenase
MVTVALVGAGLIGRAWAVVFARAGHKVKLFDSDQAMLAGAAPAVGDAIDLFADEGLIADRDAAKRLIAATGDLAEALAGADYVQESVTENLAVKRAAFGEMDRLAPPDAILASSASAIPGSAFMDVPGRRR